MTDKRDIREELRIVRGNAFGIKIHVEARRLDGSLVEDFSLADSEAVLKVMHGGNKQPWEFEVEGNDAVIAFPSTLTLGWYGLEMSGTYNDEGWRWCVPDVFQVVETNMKANVPSWTVLTDDTYMVSGVLTLTSGGGGSGSQVQADWDENNTTSPAYIKNKPDMSEYVKKISETVQTIEGGLDILGPLTGEYVFFTGDKKIEMIRTDDEIYIRQTLYSGGVMQSGRAVRISGNANGVGGAIIDIWSFGSDGYVTDYLEMKDDYVLQQWDENRNMTEHRLSQKQNIISDLAAIRAGAEAGATAVQPADLTPIDDRLDDVEYCLGDYLKETYIFNKDNKPEAATEPIYATTTLYVNVLVPPSTEYKCTCRLTEDGQSFRALYLGKLYVKDKGICFTASGHVTMYLAARTDQAYQVGTYINVCDSNGNVTYSILFQQVPYNYVMEAGYPVSICKAFSFDVEPGYYIEVPNNDSYYKIWLGQIDFEITEVKQISTDVHANSNAIAAIEQKIPAQASSSNQLADKDFVNSSIATATATYRGSYNLVSDLSLTVSATQQQIADALATKMEALSITPDNNDYCFVQIPTADATPTEIARIDRYKYDGTAWAYEFSLNNSSFTAAQWAAINSGITSGLVSKLSDLPTATELATLLAGKASTQELAGKEDITPIEAVASGTTAINAQVNKYYEVAGTVSSLTVTLPTPTANTEVTMVVVHLTIGNNPAIVVTSVNEVVRFASAYSVVANKEYELACEYNGVKWIVSSKEIAQ